MAAIAASQVRTVLSRGSGQVVEWLTINNVTTADTIDVSTIGDTSFKKVRAAAFFGQAQGTAVAGSIAGTVITLTSGGMANDTVELFVLGEA
jgi:hypothetical protein